MEQFVTLIQGPAAATVIMGCIIYGAWQFLNNIIVPRVDSMIKENNERYKEIFSQHQSDRDTWLRSIDKISDRLDKMSEVTEEMSHTVEALHRTITEITQKLQDSRNE
jgi:divalent metal cation (Fe/Co/Zn/Cd) transporter